jgi:hypothetical protein
MRKRRVVVAALLSVSIAACAPDATSPTPSAPPDPAVAPATPAASGEQATAPTAPNNGVAAEDDSPRLQAILRDVTFARASAGGYDVRHEARRMDVRDTERVSDPGTGETREVPVEGTSNPAKERQNDEWRTKAEALVHRDVTLLAETHRRFREMFADPLRLAPLPADRLPQSAIVLWDRASFEAAAARADGEIGRSMRATWLPDSGTIVTYAGTESLQGLDELACAGGRVQKGSDQALAAVGTKQLLREYAAARGARPADDDDAPAPRWLSTGLAELVSGVETTRDDLPDLASGQLTRERIVLAHVQAARQSRELAEKWTIAELLRIEASFERRVPAVLRRGEWLAPGRGPSMSELFTVRAWAFCHFLWNYDGGKYRDRFVTFVGRVLDGAGTAEVFATEIMGRPSAADWGDVEKEFEWYWTKLLERKVGRDRKTRQWYEPSTDPPSGTVEQDADFCEIWAQGQAAPKPRPK